MEVTGPISRVGDVEEKGGGGGEREEGKKRELKTALWHAKSESNSSGLERGRRRHEQKGEKKGKKGCVIRIAGRGE